MLYLSQLLGAPVNNQQNVRIGKIIDVLIQADQSDPAYPTVLLVDIEDDQVRRVPVDAIEQSNGAWRLRFPIESFSLQPTSPQKGEVSLAHEVLDKQVIDLEHKKAVRVNDVCFDDNWRILGIDKSPQGIIRRLAPSWLANALGQPTRQMLIPWDQIELIDSQRTDENNTPAPTSTTSSSHSLSRHLAELHPADIATIIQQLTPEQGARLIERLDNETAADTMEEIDTERQAHILENLSPERAAAILQDMGPDEVADLLAQLPEEKAQEMLRQMSPEESEDVQDLLEYKANTAGGMMTTHYIVLTQTRTVQEALEELRKNIQEQDVRIAYVYCVEDETQEESKPLGVVSIWDLLIAQPTQTLQELMETDLIKVHPDTPPQTVAEIMAKYNLLAVPVVNDDGIMEGVVTVDDALDVLLPRENRRDSRHPY